MGTYYFEIYAFGSDIRIDDDSYGTGSIGFVSSDGTHNDQNDAWGSMQDGGWSVGPDGGAEFYLTSGAEKVGIWVTDDDAHLNDGAGDPGSAQVLAQPVTINGVTYPAGSRVELEYAVDTDAGGDGADYYVVRLGGNGLTETQGDTGTNVGILETTSDSLQTMTLYHVDRSIDGPSLAYVDALCFAAGTRIATPDGARPVETLKIGDRVETRDHGAEPLLWVGETRLALAELADRPALWPVQFAAGSIGNTRPLRLSPQHRVLVSDWRAQLHFGQDEVLVPARALINNRDIRAVLPPGGVRYFHLLCRQHEVLRAEGALAESFFPGRSARELMGADQRDAVTRALKAVGIVAGELSASRPSLRVRDATFLSVAG